MSNLKIRTPGSMINGSKSGAVPRKLWEDEVAMDLGIWSSRQYVWKPGTSEWVWNFLEDRWYKLV